MVNFATATCFHDLLPVLYNFGHPNCVTISCFFPSRSLERSNQEFYLNYIVTLAETSIWKKFRIFPEGNIYHIYEDTLLVSVVNKEVAILSEGLSPELLDPGHCPVCSNGFYEDI